MCPWPGWSACGLARAAACSTGYASTGAVRASAAACPKPITPALIAAYHKLHAPLILYWDNLNTHITVVMREFTRANPDWLTVVQLPPYAPDLNRRRVSGATMKNDLGNLAAGNADQLAAIVRNRLKRIQYRPALIDGFLAATWLTLEPEPR